MKTNKKICAFLLVSALLMSLFTVSAFAAEKLDQNMSGADMTPGERLEYALQGTVTGMVMVFAVLGLLWGIVALSKVVFYDLPKKKANAEKVFCMTPSGSADNVINNLKYSFRLCFGDPDQGVLAANEIKNGGYTSVGAIYDESDTYSTGIYNAFKAQMVTNGITYVEQKFDKENNKDFTAQAEALKNCDIVFMPFYYTEASLFIKKSVEKGSSAVFFGCDGFDGIADLVTDVTNKITYITPFDVNSEEAGVKSFVDAFKAEYNALPDQFAADAYDVVMVLASALEKAGVTDYTLSFDELGDILYNTITAADFSYDGLTGSGMTWSKDGKCTKAPKMVTLGE